MTIPSSCGGFHDVTDANDVVRGHRERENSRDTSVTANFYLSYRPNNLCPAEDLFDPLPFTLTDLVPLMASRATIDRAAPPRRILSDVRRHVSCA